MRSLLTFILLVFISQFAISSIAVNNGLLHVYDVQPGGTYSGIIELQNTGSGDQQVQLSISDYATNYKGESLFLKSGSSERSLAQWLSLSQNMIKVEGKGKYELAYEIQIPELPSLTGSYWCLIMLEPVDELDSASLKKNSVNIKTMVRYAIQVVCHFGDSGKKSIKYLNVEVEKSEGKRFVNVDLENTGERYMRPVVELQFFDLEGKEAGIFQGPSQGLYPGSSNRFKIDVSKILPGQYKIVLLSDCGGDDVFGSNLSITIKDD